MYEKSMIAPFDVAQMIALRERVQSGNITVDELQAFADGIARVSEFLFRMRDVIQAHEELSACSVANGARLDYCDSTTPHFKYPTLKRQRPDTIVEALKAARRRRSLIRSRT